MKVRATDERATKPHPFNNNATWSRPQWQGDEGMSMEVESANFLHALVRLVKPVSVLETGTWRGFSTKAIASALFLNRAGKVTTVDIHDQKFIPYVLTEDSLDKHADGSPTWEKITGDVQEVLPSMVSEGRTFNLILCDDLHNVEHLKKELGYFESLITKPGYLMFHDTAFTKQGDIGTAVREWAAAKGYAHVPFFSARGLDIVYVR